MTNAQEELTRGLTFLRLAVDETIVDHLTMIVVEAIADARADAWQEGYQAGRIDLIAAAEWDWNDDGDPEHTLNPYRPNDE